MADHAEIDMLKNVREGLRLARRYEIEVELWNGQPIPGQLYSGTKTRESYTW